jgi:hypothetical protein
MNTSRQPIEQDDYCPDSCDRSLLSLSNLAAAVYSLHTRSLFGWLVADGWCWFVLREEYCWLVVGGWFVLREKYCWLVANKPSEQGAACLAKLPLHSCQKKKDIARLVLLLIIITVAVQRSKNFERLILRKPCRPALLLIYLQPARFDSNVYQTKMRAYQQ